MPEGSVSLQPNPARGKVEVIADVELQGVRVYDAQGKQVLAQRVAGQAAEVALDGIPSGIYMVTVYTQSGIVRKRLVVEQ